LISLSDSELQIVMSAASPLPRSERDQLLRDVSVEPRRYEVLGPGVVGRDCAFR
jgi:hypothetical protein